MGSLLCVAPPDRRLLEHQRTWPTDLISSEPYLAAQLREDPGPRGTASLHSRRVPRAVDRLLQAVTDSKGVNRLNLPWAQTPGRLYAPTSDPSSPLW